MTDKKDETVTGQQQQAAQEPISEWECSMCGRDGGPVSSCELCSGNQRFFQKRNFTLSEERQGKNPEGNKERYGPYGETGPKIVVLPGGTMPGQDPHKATKGNQSQGE